MTRPGAGRADSRRGRHNPTASPDTLGRRHLTAPVRGL
jgi:hypothetical protein